MTPAPPGGIADAVPTRAASSGRESGRRARSRRFLEGVRPRILSRYLLKLHAAPFLFATLLLTTLMLLNEVAKRFGDLVGKGLHWTVIAQVFVLSIPFILAMTLPMAVLVAVLYTFNRLASDNEISAMKASGVSMTRLLLPLCLAALVLAGGMVWLNNSLLPESNHQLQVLLTSISRKKPTFVLRERTINEVISGRLFLRVARIDRDRSTLGDVALFDARDRDHPRLIYADSGSMAYNPSQTDLYLTLYSGVTHEREPDKEDQHERLYFDQLIMRVSDVTNELELDDVGRSDREMSVSRMQVEAEAGQAIADTAAEISAQYAIALVERLLGARSPPELLGLAAEDTMAADREVKSPALQRAQRFESADDAVRQFEVYHTQATTGWERQNRFMVEINKKFSIPAACLVFVLIGAPFAVRHPRGGMGMVVAVSFAVFCAYYVAMIGVEELADRLILSPFWAMWAPNVLFAILGLVALWRAIHLER
jgi:lipopolysaccharide export system permease protein